MADLINSLGQQVSVKNDVIVEPWNAPAPNIINQVRDHFPSEVFKLTPGSNLYNFLSGLLGDAGVGGMKKALLYPRLQQSLLNTHFSDLDSFTTPFSFPRLSDEVYPQDPANELLTGEQWEQVKSADAKYRARFLDYMHGIQAGMTEEGASLIARSATGYDAEIFPRWKYLDDQISKNPIGYPNLGSTNSRNEIVVLLNVDSISQEDEYHLTSTFERLKPVGTNISFIAQGTAASAIFVREVLSSSDFFYIQKTVTGNSNLALPATSATANTWIVPGVAVEAPTYAFNVSQENIEYLTIQSASASSYQIGSYSIIEQAIFPFLENVPSPLFSFSPDQAYQTVNQMEVSSPWVVRQDGLNLFINDSYPLDNYLPLVTPTKTNKLWWSSQEQLSPAQDWLVINFNGDHYVNNLEFEISTKPIDIDIQWSTDGILWNTVSYNDKISNAYSIYYDNSSTYLWENANFSFQCLDSNNNLIKPSSLRVLFSRRTDRFPFNNTEPFAFSIDVRNLKASYLVTQTSDFNPDSGIDFLGNAYATQINTFPATAVFSSGSSFWQSQANPSQFAVESLYFNMTDGNGSVQTFDQIYIDPITMGNSLHIYYSDDDIGLPGTGSPNFAQGSSFIEGNLLWTDHFTSNNNPIWDTSAYIRGFSFPDFNHLGATADYFGVGIISVGTSFTVGGNISAQTYGQGDTSVIINNPGMYGTAGSYVELDVALQGTSLNTGYSLQYQIIGSQYGGSANLLLESIQNDTPISSTTVDVPMLNAGDVLGIRNDAQNGYVYMYTVLGGTAGTPILHGSVSTLVGADTGGKVAIIIEDSNTIPISLDAISFQELHANTATNWDSKLWTPIHKSYITKRGFLMLSNPISAKYVKLEFSKLTPSPYPIFYAPNLPFVQFNTYPSWVISYIQSLTPQIKTLNQLQPDTVITNPINLGIQKPNTTPFTDPKPESIFDYIASIIQNSNTPQFVTSAQGVFPSGQIPQIFPNNLFQQENLFSTVLTPDPLSTKYLSINGEISNSLAQEVPIGAYDVGPITSRASLGDIVLEKNTANFCFPIPCRHGYQVIQAPRESKIAYSVAIREIGFYRTDQTVYTNNSTYFETLDDNSNTNSNTFVLGNYGYVVPFSAISLGPTLPVYGFESFDSFPWFTSP